MPGNNNDDSISPVRLALFCVVVLDCALTLAAPGRELDLTLPRNGARREAVREMLEFVEKNRVRLEVITVKELIHERHRL